MQARGFFLRSAIVVAVAVGVLVPTSGLCVQPPGGQGNPGVMPPDSKPYGMTYGDWGAAWWQWAFSFPFGQDPIDDPTGQYNMLRQRGQVWFLGGTWFSSPPVPVTRNVTVPADKALFFALANIWNDYPCPDPSFQPPPCPPPDEWSAEGDTVSKCLEAWLQEGAGIWLDPSHLQLSVQVDGRALQKLSQYRGTSKMVWFRADPSWVAGDPCVTGGPQQGVADGFWIMLAPLKVGSHTIRVTALNTATGYGLDFAYNITVVPEL